jgi:hypothetical protein
MQIKIISIFQKSPRDRSNNEQQWIGLTILAESIQPTPFDAYVTQNSETDKWCVGDEKTVIDIDKDLRGKRYIKIKTKKDHTGEAIVEGLDKIYNLLNERLK